MPNFKYIKREWKNGRWRYWYKGDQPSNDTKKSYPEERATDKTEDEKYLKQKQKQKEKAEAKAAREKQTNRVLGYEKKEKLEKASENLEFRKGVLDKNKTLVSEAQYKQALADYKAAELAYNKTIAKKIESAKAFVSRQEHIKELKSKTTYPEERATDLTENPDYLKSKKLEKVRKEAEKRFHEYQPLSARGESWVRNLFK